MLVPCIHVTGSFHPLKNHARRHYSDKIQRMFSGQQLQDRATLPLPTATATKPTNPFQLPGGREGNRSAGSVNEERLFAPRPSSYRTSPKALGITMAMQAGGASPIPLLPSFFPAPPSVGRTSLRSGTSPFLVRSRGT